jgi:uncharacterized membrane protein YoaK (UPF0700 family)
MSTSIARDREALERNLPAPDTVAEQSRLERRLPPLLSVIAGMVDLTGFFTLGNIFTAHITGNLVAVAAAVVRGGASLNLAQAFAIPVAIFALAAGWLIAQASGKRGPELARQLLVIQFLLLAIVLVFSIFAHPSAHPHGLMAGIAAMIAVSAMACQYALFRLAIPEAVSTAVMTGNLTNAVLALMDRRSRTPLMTGDDDRLKKSIYLLVGFLVGCVVAAAAIPLLGDWIWILPVALSAVAIFWR